MIEVNGIGFPNRGAELMLHAVASRIRSHQPEERILCRPTAGDRRSAQTIVSLGGCLKLDTRFRGVSLHRIWNVLPERLLATYDLGTERHADALLDASGLAYSEQWGAQACRLGGRLAARYRRRGRPVVLLPQAFGPFSSKQMRKAAQHLLESSNLVFARDEESADACVSVAPHASISLCPDLTIGFTPAGKAAEALPHAGIAIIPNCRMIDKAGIPRSDYAAFLAGCANTLATAGHDVVWLNHEGPDDLGIIAAVRRGLSPRAAGKVVDGLDAPAIKSYLGACTGVISSRFHGLVSALSQGVPSAGTGWNHKYKTLMKSFDCSALLFDPRTGEAGGSACANSLMERVRDDPHRAALRATAQLLRERVDAMWHRTFAVLDGASQDRSSTCAPTA